MEPYRMSFCLLLMAFTLEFHCLGGETQPANFTFQQQSVSLTDSEQFGFCSVELYFIELYGNI